MAAYAELISVAIGSGLTVKILDIVYQEIRRRHERGSTAQRLIEHNIDPFLKTLDEAVGKFRSLACEDFLSLGDQSAETLSPGYSKQYAATMYLITSFWARIEILRRDNLFVYIAQEERGLHLQKFIKCLESRRVRLVDRGTQRACAELTLEGQVGSKIVGYVGYCRSIAEDKNTQYWLRPLAKLLSDSGDKRNRQRLLIYGAILHAMMDTLDLKRHITSARPPFPNKLSKKSRRDLQYRVFSQYLPFVERPERYYAP